MQNYWNFYLSCKQQQLYGPVNNRDFRETGPRDQASVSHLIRRINFLKVLRFSFPVPVAGSAARFAAENIKNF